MGQVPFNLGACAEAKVSNMSDVGESARRCAEAVFLAYSDIRPTPKHVGVECMSKDSLARVDFLQPTILVRHSIYVTM
jgi:hypothetical protein